MLNRTVAEFWLFTESSQNAEPEWAFDAFLIGQLLLLVAGHGCPSVTGAALGPRTSSRPSTCAPRAHRQSGLLVREVAVPRIYGADDSGLAGYSAWDVLAPLAVTFERIYVGLVAAYSAGSSSLADRCARAAWATERCDEALATSKGTMSASSNSRPRESNGVVLIALSQRTDSWSSSSRRLQTRVDQPVSQTDVAESPAERGQQEIAPFPHSSMGRRATASSARNCAGAAWVS